MVGKCSPMNSSRYLKISKHGSSFLFVPMRKSTSCCLSILIFPHKGLHWMMWNRRWESLDVALLMRYGVSLILVPHVSSLIELFLAGVVVEIGLFYFLFVFFRVFLGYASVFLFFWGVGEFHQWFGLSKILEVSFHLNTSPSFNLNQWRDEGSNHTLSDSFPIQIGVEWMHGAFHDTQICQRVSRLKLLDLETSETQESWLMLSPMVKYKLYSL